MIEPMTSGVKYSFTISGDKNKPSIIAIFTPMVLLLTGFFIVPPFD
jgi:hypothetical protein